MHANDCGGDGGDCGYDGCCCLVDEVFAISDDVWLLNRNLPILRCSSYPRRHLKVSGLCVSIPYCEDSEGHLPSAKRFSIFGLLFTTVLIYLLT